MTKSIAFYELANEDIYNCKMDIAKKINEISKEVDLSVFCKGYSKFKYNFGAFCVPEAYGYEGLIFTFSSEDYLYALDLHDNCNVMFVFSGQHFDILSLLNNEKDILGGIVCLNNQQALEINRILGVECSLVEDILTRELNHDKK